MVRHPPPTLIMKKGTPKRALLICYPSFALLDPSWFKHNPKRESVSKGSRIPRSRFLKLRYLKGLKARHIVSRWRKPPEPCEKKYLRPEGPTPKPVCRPFRPQFVDDSDPVARATGIW